MPGSSEQTCPNGCDLTLNGTHQAPPDCDLLPRDPDEAAIAAARQRAEEQLAALGDGFVSVTRAVGYGAGPLPGFPLPMVRRELPEPVEFAVAPAEPRVRVVGLPDTVHLPGDVLEALDHLARVCRTAYGMGVEVTADGDLDEVRDALETIRRRLDL